MEIRTNKTIAEMLERQKKDPKAFAGTVIFDLLNERASLAIKEQNIIDEMKKIETEIAERMGEVGNRLTKTRGAIEYVELKIVDAYENAQESKEKSQEIS